MTQANAAGVVDVEQMTPTLEDHYYGVVGELAEQGRPETDVEVSVYKMNAGKPGRSLVGRLSWAEFERQGIEAKLGTLEGPGRYAVRFHAKGEGGRYRRLHYLDVEPPIVTNPPPPVRAEPAVQMPVQHAPPQLGQLPAYQPVPSAPIDPTQLMVAMMNAQMGIVAPLITAAIEPKVQTGGSTFDEVFKLAEKWNSRVASESSGGEIVGMVRAALEAAGPVLARIAERMEQQPRPTPTPARPVPNAVPRPTPTPAPVEPVKAEPTDPDAEIIEAIQREEPDTDAETLRAFVVGKVRSIAGVVRAAEVGKMNDVQAAGVVDAALEGLGIPHAFLKNETWGLEGLARIIVAAEPQLDPEYVGVVVETWASAEDETPDADNVGDAARSETKEGNDGEGANDAGDDPEG